jgi:menaquinone-dependent protoporphyrinogen oxidase
MRVLVLYSSRHGHTRRIAEFIAECVAQRDCEPDLRDIDSAEPAHLSDYAAAILVSPIHLGRHAKGIVAFAHDHHLSLEALPSAFVSVSLTQASVESTELDLQLRAQAHHDLSVAIGHFIEVTGWHPRAIHRAAGALAYTRYNWFVRWMMKRIAKKQCGPTDTTRDHVYTQWDALERFVAEFLAGARQRVSASPSTSSSTATSASTSTGFVR